MAVPTGALRSTLAAISAPARNRAAAAAALAGQAGDLALTTSAHLAGQAAGTVAGHAAHAVQQVGAHFDQPPRPADDGGPRLGGIIGHSRGRRAWSRSGRGYIEVRGLARASGSRLGQEVTQQLAKIRGVRWAELNAISEQVLIAFDEERVDFGTLLEAVQAVEDAHGTGADGFAHDGTNHPLDDAPLNAAMVSLVSDCLALTVALGGKLLPVRPLPPSARVAIALIDGQPALRREMQRRAGRLGTDLVLALGNAAASGLTQDPSLLSIDALHRLLLVAETRAGKAAWERREAELRDVTVPSRSVRRGHRPRPLPDGPVETFAAQAAKGSLAGTAGTLAVTRSPGAAAETLMAAVPRAARHGRESFAALLGRELSHRGVIPLDGAAYRKLDRITAVVVDSRALSRAGAAGPAGNAGDGGDGGDGAGDLDPLAEHVLTAARGSGSRVLLTAHHRAADLTRYADETLAADVALAEHVRRLQRDGNGVLVLSSHDEQALEDADVAVAVAGPDRPACWAADLVCGPGLDQAWHLLHALGAAREASKRSVKLSAGGSALGTLLAVTRGRQRRTTGLLNLAPVHVASLMAMISSAVAVRQLAATEHPPPMPRARWHAMTAGQALEAARSIAAQQPPQPGRERTAPPGPLNAGYQLAGAVGRELRDPLTPVLLLGAAASAIVGSTVDAVLVATVMTGSALISGVQRVRAERALRGLTLGEDIYARRAKWQPAHGGGALPGHEELARGEHETVPVPELRPGDLIAIRANDVVPADARLLHVTDLEMDESSLTGESLPVAKSAERAPGADLAERTCMIYDGTTVLAGDAYAVVVASGTATESGRAVAMAGKPTPPGGVQAELNELMGVALPVTGVSGALVSALAAVRGVPLRQAVASGVAVAVAAVPEGLSLVATVAQSAAARRLSRRGVLVRSSRTLGTMGQVDTVCFDKTGTLTEGRLRLTRLSGMNGDFSPESDTGRRLLVAAWRACPPVNGNGGTRKLAHATDRAIADTGQDMLGDDTAWRPGSVLPFETSRGYSAAAGTADGRPYLCTKGTPEEIVARCDRMVDGSGTVQLTRERRRAALRRAKRLAEAGLRVLAVADGHPGAGETAGLDSVSGLDGVSGLALVGFAGITDSPRQQAVAAIKRLTDADVAVAMITGDHPDTARTIAAELGIPGADRVLTGADLERLTEDERIAAVSKTAVFARATPEHKVQIVQSLQRVGRTVAVTGDGVNDAAAIRLGDVGIAVTGSRTRAARSAADMIAQSDDLESIADALLEGQSLWRSVANAVSILVGGNAGEVGFTLYGTAVGGHAPLGTRQLLLVNILTDMLPALAVALAPPAGDGQGSHPVHDGLRKTLVPGIAVRGGATALGAITAWHIGRATGRARRASTMGLASLVLTQLAQTMHTGWRSPSVLATGTVSALVLAALVQTPGVSQFFGCTPLGPVAWASVAASAAAGTGAAVLLPRVAPKLIARVTPSAAVQEAT